MALYYNADGNLQNFDEWEHVVLCAKCGTPYHQKCEEQVPGFRDKDYDTCPYCGYVNGSSMSVEYRNNPMPESAIIKYFKDKAKGDTV